MSITSEPVSRQGDVRRLRDHGEVLGMLTALGGSARTELLGMMPADAETPAALRARRDEDLELLARGVSGLLVCDRHWKHDRDVSEEIRVRSAAGARIRVMDGVPHHLAIVDRRVALLPAGTMSDERGAMVVREPWTVASLRRLFLGIWRRLNDVDDLRPGEQLDPSRYRPVLELMSSGMTDEAAARDLNVSLRTYRRYVADAMNVLKARSRFQAGVLAVELGWL